MSVPAQTYNYNAKYNFNVLTLVRHEINGAADTGQALADVLQSMKTQVASTFGAKMLTSGHWFKVNSITPNGTTGSPTEHYNWYGGIGIRDGWNVPVSGWVVVDFDCDVKDMMAHNSPQLWDIIIAVAEAIVNAIAANPQLFLVGCIVVAGLLAFALVLYELTNLTTAATKLFQTPGGAIAGIAFVVVGGVALIVALPLLFEYLSGGKKGRRK